MRPHRHRLGTLSGGGDRTGPLSDENAHAARLTDGRSDQDVPRNSAVSAVAARRVRVMIQFSGRGLRPSYAVPVTYL